MTDSFDSIAAGDPKDVLHLGFRTMNPAMVRDAIERGADVNATIIGIPFWGQVIVHENMFQDVPKTFLKHNGYKPEDAATLQQRMNEVFELLLDQPINLDIENMYGNTYADRVIADFMHDPKRHDRLATIVTSMIHDSAVAGRPYDINYTGIWTQRYLSAQTNRDTVPKAEDVASEFSQILQVVRERLQNPQTTKEKFLVEALPEFVTVWKNKKPPATGDLPIPSTEINKVTGEMDTAYDALELMHNLMLPKFAENHLKLTPEQTELLTAAIAKETSPDDLVRYDDWGDDQYEVYIMVRDAYQESPMCAYVQRKAAKIANELVSRGQIEMQFQQMAASYKKDMLGGSDGNDPGLAKS